MEVTTELLTGQVLDSTGWENNEVSQKALFQMQTQGKKTAGANHGPSTII